jgi:hypothetical protein
VWSSVAAVLLARALHRAVLSSRSRRVQRINAQQSGSAAAAAAVGGTAVPKNSILVVGGTGTLGRQVVRKALDEGYEVRCIVKPRNNPADFLRDWGATTVQVRGFGMSTLKASVLCCLHCWGGEGAVWTAAAPAVSVLLPAAVLWTALAVHK